MDNNDKMYDNRVNTPKKVLNRVANGCLQKITVLVYLPSQAGHSNLWAALGGIKGLDPSKPLCLSQATDHQVEQHQNNYYGVSVNILPSLQL